MPLQTDIVSNHASQKGSLMDTKVIKFIGFTLSFLIFILFCIAFIQYPGKKYVYTIFTLMLNLLLFFGCRKDRIFFDTFIGLFFWLGFWFKFSVRMAFMGGKFFESIGSNFDFSGAAYDHALLVTSCGVFAILLASYIRGKFFFSYGDEKNRTLEGLFIFYGKHRKFIWIAFLLFFITIAVSNIYFGIYQRGSVPRTILPFKLSAIYTWLLLFGSASFSALMLEFEIKFKRKATYPVVVLSLLEGFFSNVSMLSRGMVFNIFALAVGTAKRLKTKSIPVSFRLIGLSLFLFVLLFMGSLNLVNQLRFYHFSKYQFGFKSFQDLAWFTRGKTPSVSGNIARLMLDRWVGIEGVIAVSSYPNLGWDLWKQAWNEKYSDNGTSFYDSEISESAYIKFYNNLDLSRHHVISLPGILAFLYYPGSFVFLFITMFLAASIASGIEIIVYKFCGYNVILTSLMAEVIAYRYVHFGYAPGHSYLLFGAIFINILLFYLLNKCFVLKYKVL